MKIKNTIVAAVIGALSIGGAAPVHASTDEGPCQIMGPYYFEGVRDCACLIAAMAADAIKPDSPQPCVH